MNPHLVQRDENGDAIYVHSEDCRGYCDFACNGSEGDRLAEELNEKVLAWLRERGYPEPTETSSQ